MTSGPNFRRRRVIGLLLLCGLLAPLPATLLGAPEQGRWIFAVAGSAIALAILALPLDQLRAPAQDSYTFRPRLRHLVLDAQNPLGVAAVAFQLLLVAGLAFVAAMFATGIGLQPVEPRPDLRIFGPIFGVAIAVLLWPIVDWVASSVHFTKTQLHILTDRRVKTIEVGAIEALVVRHGRRSPMHNGAVLVLQLRDNVRIPLPGTTKDAARFLTTLKQATGVALPRVDRTIRPRSA